MASKHDKMLRKLKEIELKAKAESEAFIKEHYPDFQNTVSVIISLHKVEVNRMPKKSMEIGFDRGSYFKTYPHSDESLISMYSVHYQKKKP